MGDTHSDTRTVDRNLRNEMSSGGMIYIPAFIKIGSAVQKLIGGDTQTTL
jgi:hypothetical protein